MNITNYFAFQIFTSRLSCNTGEIAAKWLSETGEHITCDFGG